MGKTNNVYILRARRKRMIKRGIVLVIIISGILALFITKSDFFLVKDITFKGNKIIKTDALIKEGDSFKGENILFLKEKDVISKIKTNPYIDKVEINRHLPKTLEIDVTEKNIGYYLKQGETYNLLSSDLVFLESTNKIDDKNLIEIVGLKNGELKIGEPIVDTTNDTRLLSLFESLYQIQKANKTNHKITKVDISKMTNILVYFGDVMVKIGDGEDLIKRMNSALGILEDKTLNIKNGYIDVSFEGAPIVKKEKEKEKPKEKPKEKEKEKPKETIKKEKSN